MNIKTLLLTLLLCGGSALSASAQSSSEERYDGAVVADEGAWCWFADPRAMRNQDETHGVDATYIGYIDVHGNVKASQLTGNTQEDVLIRSVFQPDDHDNPTFLRLPDGRIMIFYTRHTDEARFYYRISRVAGDITRLGEEKIISVANNTTYPSPFILSDDPDHIYLCWRGIGWHPTIAALSMPDENDDVSITYGPYQMVQSTGARPYAKYQSNGKDKIYVSYTTGHPDNEYPNWLYFNVINLNVQNGTANPQLCDVKGNVLSTIANGKFQVNKTTSYKSQYPNTIIDAPSAYRDWVWQITLDENELPVVAMVRISQDKNSHEYYYARWTGSQWQLTDLAYGGGRFHSSNTEYCYSGGMAIDPDDIHQVYLSIPTASASTGTDVYEIWKYTLDDNGTVTAKEQVTRNSLKNNVRPYVLPGSTGSDVRLCWMNGDYYYWLVNSTYPKGYPTSIRTSAELPAAEIAPFEPFTSETGKRTMETTTTVTPALTKLPSTFTLAVLWGVNDVNTSQTFLTTNTFTYGLDGTTQQPYVKVGDETYSSQNRLGTSDNAASGGNNFFKALGSFFTTITYDGSTLTVYRNGLIDQRLDIEGLTLDNLTLGGFSGSLYYYAVGGACLNQPSVVSNMNDHELVSLSVPSVVRTDIVLPTTSSIGTPVTWTSSNSDILSATGLVNLPEEATEVTLTATVGSQSQDYTVTVMPRDIDQNIRYSHEEEIDMLENTATGFSTNNYLLAPEGLLTGLRSYTVIVIATPVSLSGQPRLYDFGSGSGNSFFLRANTLAAGIKYGGGTTTMVSSPTQLEVGNTYYLAVTFNAATKTTTLYLNGEELVSGTANQSEPYQLVESASDTRNYIGRTQWWDSNYSADNQDFVGTIGGFRLYDIALTRQEICQELGLPYEEEKLASALQNGDFEQTYTQLEGTGVNNDRAIYQPEAWTVDRTNGDSNDLTALQEGDFYYSDFFASCPASTSDSKKSYWIRQKWGTSTIALTQRVRLPEGQHTLTAQVWKSGLGGNALVYVQGDDGTSLSAAPEQNAEAWQQVSIPFETDGKTATTIRLEAVHNSAGSEKIIGFDNVAISTLTDAIQSVKETEPTSTSADVFDMTGRKVNHPVHGLYISKGQKVYVK